MQLGVNTAKLTPVVARIFVKRRGSRSIEVSVSCVCWHHLIYTNDGGVSHVHRASEYEGVRLIQLLCGRNSSVFGVTVILGHREEGVQFGHRELQPDVWEECV